MEFKTISDDKTKKRLLSNKLKSLYLRGLRDLNSRARFQTYSLSRGAPSPLG